MVSGTSAFAWRKKMSNSYNPTLIQKYLSGLLNPDEMHQLEKDALNDPFLQDAIDGLSTLENKGHSQLSSLQKRLALRLNEQVEEKSRSYFNFQRLAIASTAAVLLIALCVLFWMRQQPRSIASGNTRHIQVELTTPPGIYTLKGNAKPETGWKRFAESLIFPDQVPPGTRIELEIQIKAGMVHKVKVLQNSGTFNTRPLVDKIRHSSGWTGDSVRLKIQY